MMKLVTVLCSCLIITVFSIAEAETKVGFRQITIVEPVAIQRGTTQPLTLRSNFTLNVPTPASSIVPA